MILKKAMITYYSDNLEKSKNYILSILSDLGIFEVELLEDFNLNSLDYNENFNNKLDVWAIIFYLPDNRFFNKKISMIEENLKNVDDLIYDIYTSNLDTESYKDEWKKSFNTTKITDKIVVNPSWLEYEAKKDEIVINIDPSMAFGTGTHETTSLCIELLEKYGDKKDLLDIGCGSGILMLVAKKIGIENVTGIDIDANCFDVVNTNFEKNNLHGHRIIIGNLVDKIDAKYDIVVSNILVDVLEKLLNDIQKVLKKDSIIIFSGILKEKKDRFIIKAKEIGLEFIEEKNKNNWTGLVFKYEG